MREAQGNILLQDAAERPADLKKSQQQPGLLFADKRPREYAAELLDSTEKAMDEHLIGKVPTEHLELIKRHILNGLIKKRTVKK